MIRNRVKVGVTFNVSIYHWSKCRRSKCTFENVISSVIILIKLSFQYEVLLIAAWNC